MRTRRSPRNQEILWRALGEAKKPKPVNRVKTPLVSRAEMRRITMARWLASRKQEDSE